MNEHILLNMIAGSLPCDKNVRNKVKVKFFGFFKVPLYNYTTETL